MSQRILAFEGEDFARSYFLFSWRAKQDGPHHLTASERVHGLWGSEPDDDLQVSDSISQRMSVQRRRPGFSLGLRELLELKHRGTCLYCGERGAEIDHILARAHGGSDLEPNLALACYPCNRSKRTKTIWEWLRERPDLDERAIRQRWLEARGDIALPGLPK